MGRKSNAQKAMEAAQRVEAEAPKEAMALLPEPDHVAQEISEPVPVPEIQEAKKEKVIEQKAVEPANLIDGLNARIIQLEQDKVEFLDWKYQLEAHLKRMIGFKYSARKLT